MNCRHCGAQLPSDANFCTQCGKPQTPDGSTYEPAVQWETLEIEIRDEGPEMHPVGWLISAAGGMALRGVLVARARGPGGEYIAAQRLFHRTSSEPIEMLQGLSRQAGLEALEDLKQELRAKGWSPDQEKPQYGPWWYCYRYRRPFDPRRQYSDELLEESSSEESSSEESSSEESSSEESSSSKKSSKRKFWPLLAAVVAGALVLAILSQQSATSTSPPPSASTSPPPSASSTGAPAAPAIAPGTILYQAEWANGLSGWSGTSQWKQVSGMLVSDGTNADATMAATTLVAPYAPPVADYSVEATIQFQKCSGSSDCGFGIAARLTQDSSGQESGYVGGMSELNNYSSNSAHANMHRDTVVLSQVIYALDTAWHTYRLDVRGNQLRLFIDGYLEVEGTDNELSVPGHFGLTSDQSQMSVRTFKVTAL